MSACDTIDPASQARVVGRLQEKLRESMNDVAKETLESTASMLFELLLTIHCAQRRRNACSALLREQIRHVQGEKSLTMHVLHLESLEQDDIDALYRIGGAHIVDLQFQFEAIATGDPLPHGLLLIGLLVRHGPDAAGSASDAMAERDRLRQPYAPPTTRRRQTVPIDWRNSVVSTNDRALVLELLDDVYNMYELMKLGIKVALEPIARANYSTPSAARKRTLAAATAEESISATIDDDEARPLGYTLHFSGVPSFSDAFTAHLRHKYASRWLTCVIIFPCVRSARSGKQVLMAPELAISISREGLLPCDSLPFAVRGAKRLCQKVYSNPVSE